MIFFLFLLSLSVSAQQACMGPYYDSLDYDLRCVACGVQQSTPARALASPGWLTLMSIVSQKYHIADQKKADEDFRRKKLIQLIGAYGVCFNSSYRASVSQPFWQRVSKGRQPASDIAGDRYTNDFWNSFGLRFDSASIGGLFGCDEEKGCDSGIDHFFKTDGDKWSEMTPKERQQHFAKAVQNRTDKVRTQGSFAMCINEVKEQMSELYSGVNGAFNFTDHDEKKPNIANIAFCQNLADSCNIDKSFCLKDWKYTPPRGISSESK